MANVETLSNLERRVSMTLPVKDIDQQVEGGKGEDFQFVLAEGRMLPQFDAAARGMSPGESKTFPLKFPDDYHGKEVAGKEASFEISMKKIEQPELPPLDAEFAKQLGVADGDVAKM